ncbi:hypothetical protein NKJ95_24345, partial [Mesorhizobium sp. M0012]|uniref:hypothetical protein n=1 Tax=Mesorhizobium sp. M0012 TaxID=2956840 RepID=UPI003338CDE6
IIASPQRKLDPSTPVLRFSWLPDAHVCGLHRMRTLRLEQTRGKVSDRDMFSPFCSHQMQVRRGEAYNLANAPIAAGCALSAHAPGQVYSPSHYEVVLRGQLAMRL